MNKFLQIIFISSIISFSGCCYKKACVCAPVSEILQLIFNYNQTDSHSFPDGSQSDFYFIQADSNHVLIDSIQINLDPNGNLNNGYYYFPIREERFNKFQGYDFIIVNRPLGFADTIADLNYTKKAYTRVCNQCPFGNDYYSCEMIENVSFKNKNISIAADSLLVNRN